MVQLTWDFYCRRLEGPTDLVKLTLPLSLASLPSYSAFQKWNWNVRKVCGVGIWGDISAFGEPLTSGRRKIGLGKYSKGHHQSSLIFPDPANKYPPLERKRETFSFWHSTAIHLHKYFQEFWWCNHLKLVKYDMIRWGNFRWILNVM